MAPPSGNGLAVPNNGSGARSTGASPFTRRAVEARDALGSTSVPPARPALGTLRTSRSSVRVPSPMVLTRQASSTPMVRTVSALAGALAEPVEGLTLHGADPSGRAGDVPRQPSGPLHDEDGAGAPASTQGDDVSSEPARKGNRSRRTSNDIVLPGALAEAYQLDGALGSGAFGTVWRATHIDSGELVAIKVIERTRQLVEDFRLELNEAEILKSLDHPNIVQLKELAADPSGDGCFLVMELVDGGHLQASLDEHGAYEDAHAAEIFRQVAEAVAYLHARNITHRDIKPENILFVRGAGLTVKLTDFGMSTMKDGKLTTLCGTPSYCAPELLLGDGYGKAVDMWSLGVLAFVLVCAALPFVSSTREGLFEKIKKGGYEFPSTKQVSTTAQDLITRLLKTNPMQRYSSREALQHPWLTGDDGLATTHNSLVTVHEMMRSFNAERRWRRSTMLVRWVVRLQRVIALRNGAPWPPQQPRRPSAAPLAAFGPGLACVACARRASDTMLDVAGEKHEKLALPGLPGNAKGGSDGGSSPKTNVRAARRTNVLPPVNSEKSRSRLDPASRSTEAVAPSSRKR